MQMIHDTIDRLPTETAAPIPWAQFRAELEAMYQPPMVAKTTRAKMVQVLRELEALEVKSTADLTTTLIARFVAARPADQSAYTLHAVLAVVRTICTYAETAGYLRVNPFRLRKLSKWVRLPMLEGRRHLDRGEVRRILDHMAKRVEEKEGWAQWRFRRDLAVAAIIAYTGMRKNECLAMHVSDVDMGNRILWVRPHSRALKTRASEAPLPIAPALVPILESWLANRLAAPYGFPIPKECPYLIPTCNRKAPWIHGAPGGKALDRFKAAAAAAGVEGATFQMLRRSWATHAEPLMGAAMIARILRHTTTRTSEAHYRRADLANIRDSVKDFDF